MESDSNNGTAFESRLNDIITGLRSEDLTMILASETSYLRQKFILHLAFYQCLKI